jgi:hypothetical protein
MYRSYFHFVETSCAMWREFLDDPLKTISKHGGKSELYYRKVEYSKYNEIRQKLINTIRPCHITVGPRRWAVTAKTKVKILRDFKWAKCSWLNSICCGMRPKFRLNVRPRNGSSVRMGYSVCSKADHYCWCQNLGKCTAWRDGTHK